MHPLKSLNVMGDGGAISTNNPEYAKWLVKYRNHGMINRDEIDFYGVNSRMQPLQAVVADLELENLDKVVARRNEIASKYDRDLAPLAPRVLVPPRLSNDIETFCLYMLQVDKRNELISFLNTVGVEAKVHYPVPLHLQKASQVIGIDCQNLENSESQAKKIITIFLFIKILIR
jgi:dTDP-4-amino-4,6-dideoxygalactose transaminase